MSSDHISKHNKDKSSDSVTNVNFGESDHFSGIYDVYIGGTGVVPPLKLVDRQSLRKWWHQILKDYNHYSCYAVFLALPSNQGAINYLTKFGKELDLISGENCFVVALSDTKFKCSDFNENVWCEAIEEHITEGHCIKVAQLFDIGFDTFPCLVVFEDIRSTKHIVIKLRMMTDEEIAEKMQTIFSILQKAIKRKKNPIESLESYSNNEKLQQAGHSIVSQIRSFTEKTFEVAMEAWIKASIK